MCGIAGFISKTDNTLNSEGILSRFKSSMGHRGPNHFGSHSDGGFCVSNLRLAIVDIAQGNQPIYSEDRQWGIVYNGEVYNHEDMRKDLIGKGHKFNTHADTEVLLKMFIEYGIEAFKAFNGMFAICLFRTDGSEFFIVRDRFGMKPLYLYEDGNKLIFSSEIKGILAQQDIDRSLNREGIQDYLFFRYIVSPLTVFMKIRSIEPGTYVHFKNKKGITWRFSDIKYSNENFGISFQDAVDRLDELLHNSVRSQLMGEVPVGVLLSGGLDSSTIAHYVSKNGANLTTYNVGFPDVNEFEYSRSVAQKYGLKYVEVETSINELVNSFDEVMDAIDQPMADPACFPLYVLCRVLKQDVTVVLSGEAGDEQFGGYNQYKQMMTEKIPFDQRYSEFLKRSFYFNENFSLLKNPRDIAPRYHKSMKYFEENSPLNGMLAYDLRTWMPDNLMMKADKILMKHSLEGRFPFLDLELFKFASNLPEEFKIKNGEITKYILKELMEPKLPKGVVKRPKMGFTVPVHQMLSRLKDRVINSVVEAKDTELSDILDLNQIHSIFLSYFKEQSSVSDLKIWTLFILLYWNNKLKSISS